MSDDSFFREVDEELRSERFQNFWSVWGRWLIAGAIVLVVALAAWRFYEYREAQQAAASGDAFMAAVRLAEDGKSDEAMTALAALESESGETYVTLARMRQAAELAQKGEAAAAVEAYDAVISDNDADESLRAIARIRAGLLLVDTGTVTEVQARVGPLTAPGAPWRFSAGEALGLAYYKAGDLNNAFKQFDALAKDAETPPSLRQRTRIMLDLIASRGGPVQES